MERRGISLQGLIGLVSMAVSLVVAIIVGAVAYGHLEATAQENKRKIEDMQRTEDAITDLKVRGAQIDERTKQIQREQKDAKQRDERIEGLLRSLEVRTRGLEFRTEP